MNNSTKRIAVIGTGNWGKNHVRNFHELGVLAAICDDNKDHYSFFSHTSTVHATSTGDDLNFGACQLIGT